MARRRAWLPLVHALDAALDALFASPRARPFWLAVLLVSGFVGGFGYGHGAGAQAQAAAERPVRTPRTDHYAKEPTPFSSRFPVVAFGAPAGPDTNIQQLGQFRVPSGEGIELVFGRLELVGRNAAGSPTETLWVDGVLSGNPVRSFRAPYAVVANVTLINRAYDALVTDCCRARTGTLALTLEDALAGSDVRVADIGADGILAVAIADDVRVSRASLSYCVADAGRGRFECGASEPEPYSPPGFFELDWGGIERPAKPFL
ncbi:MAG: hypothetical protein HYV07_15610 [Deltaproteobacteria bacterium]|nr:hypothetical protein [Deltaproteobacteria bacterium]